MEAIGCITFIILINGALVLLKWLFGPSTGETIFFWILGIGGIIASIGILTGYNWGDGDDYTRGPPPPDL